MCDPITIGAIGLASSLGSTAVGMFQASAANAANEKQFLAAAKIANEQVVQEYDALALRNVQDEGQSFQAVASTLSQLREAQGIAAARAADSGVAGASVAALFQEFERDAGEAVALEARNSKLRRAQSIIEKKALFTRTKGAILGATPQVIPPPDIIGGVSDGVLALSSGIAQSRRDSARAGLSQPSAINEGA